MNKGYVGHWCKLSANVRCDYCGKITKYILDVTGGETKGRFCSKQHYLRAYEEMHRKKEEEEDVYKNIYPKGGK